MKKKGQRSFDNENVHGIIMLGLSLYPLYSPRLLDIFHQCGRVIDSSPASHKSSAPSETKCFTSEFVQASKTFSDHLTRNASATHNNKAWGLSNAEPSWYIQSTQTCRTLYLSIFRCHLGYTPHVWSPQSIGLLKRVENVQHRETKLVLKLPFRCDVTDKTCLQLTNPVTYLILA